MIEVPMGRSRQVSVVAILFLLSIAVYLPALELGFVEFNDNVYVSRNPNVKAGLCWNSVVYAFTTFDSGNWIPLTWLSYLIDSTCFGVRPAAFHAVNMLLHALNAVLLYFWLTRMTGAFWRSLAVAALFAVHPLHVESVAWVSERKDVLSTFFFLLMLIAYDNFGLKPNMWRFIPVLIAFLLGLMSKSMLVTAPILLWLLDLFPGRQWSADRFHANDLEEPSPHTDLRKIIEKFPLLILAVAISYVTIRAQGSGQTTAFTSFVRIPMNFRIGNAMNGYVWYLIKTFVPTGLCAMYSHPMRRLDWPAVAGSIAVLLTLSGIAVAMIQRRSYLIFGWSWFLLTLLPVIGLFQVGTQAYADRYSYIPQIGLLIAIVWYAESRLHRFSSGSGVGAVSLVLAVIGLSWVTVHQIGFWKDTETLWKRALAVSPSNWEAHRQLGSIYLQQEKFDEAIDQFQSVVKWNPALPSPLENLGWIHQQRKEWLDAVNYYEQCLELNPGSEFAMRNLLLLLQQQKKGIQARLYLERYTRRCPTDVKMLNQLGLMLARNGEFRAALTEFKQAEMNAPDDPNTQTNLGLTLSELKRLTEARVHLEKAVALQPQDLNSHINLGLLYVKLDLKDEARKQFLEALQIDPDDADARQQLDLLPLL
jgi:Flp pilus assembly protein TadD